MSTLSIDLRLATLRCTDVYMSTGVAYVSDEISFAEHTVVVEISGSEQRKSTKQSLILQRGFGPSSPRLPKKSTSRIL